MRSLLIIGTVLIASHYTFAQQYSYEMWHEGKIILTTGDTLRGLVKYDIQQDLVQFNDQKKTTEAYTPRKILFFEIYDNTVSRYRTFFSLPFAASGYYKTPVFFELLEEGKMTVLGRESLEYRTFSSPYYYGSYTRLVLVNKFFLMDDKGDIKEFTGKKADLLSLMGRYGEEVDKYIKANRLKIEDRYDFARAVDYYNSFFEKEQ
ncbi:MAG: hypothetical protein MUC73_12215 [Cyclobacteriaceae bacterium]|nr:hypothetical protein [Cyclobacteriaceae bacterium]